MNEYIKDTVECYRTLILDTLDFIWKHPETGYREVKTSAYLENIFENLGYDLVKAGDIPGFYTVFDTGRPGPEILVLGELDALLCPEHPDADPETGAVHVCGHSAQCAALVGVAAALKVPKVNEKLCGRIRLCAVPAEEMIEIEYREELRKQGIIKYYGGKTEFLRRGYFDGVDMAFMVHTSNEFMAYVGAVGFVAKTVTYQGKAAHGAAAWEGINALNAAMLGQSAVHALRETFKEEDIIRYHPILTAGGVAVNAVPSIARLETFVRGNSFEAIRETNKNINRALCGAALSIGANVEINDIPGYAPFKNNEDLLAVAREALTLTFPEKTLHETGETNSGSTDMGDLGAVMPIMHPYAGGTIGCGHGKDYYIADPEQACIESAMWQVAMLTMLLEKDGSRARQVLDGYEPPFASKEEYCAYLDSYFTEGDCIIYTDEGAMVKY